MAGFPRRNEEIPCDSVASSSQLSFANTMSDEYVPEPWMKEMLDQSAIDNMPFDWDVIDSYNSSNAVSFDTNSNPTFDMSAEQNAPAMSSSSMSNQFPGDFQASLTNSVADPNIFFFGQSGYQSTCPSLSPDTPFLDQSPSLDQFASFDTTPTLPSPVTGSSGDASQVVFDQVAAAFRDLARARAEADPRPLSQKQKQREASIALYLQRLRDTCNEACAMLGSDSQQQSNSQLDDSMNATQAFSQDAASFEPLMAFFQPNAVPTHTTANTFSSGSSRSSPDTFAAVSSSSGSPVPPSKRQRPAAPVAGGVEMVMDLNMNVATTMPRKHKPRTQAQRERYLAVRNQGACEKHKKQHKRCTCVDNTVDVKLGKQEQNGVKRSRANRPTQSIRVSSPKTEPTCAPTTILQTPKQPDLHSSGFCPGGCVGDCNCFTDDTEELHWQFQQYLTDERQQSAARGQYRSHNGREARTNTTANGNVIALPPTSCSPTVKPPRASSDDNSPSTWDNAAVSRSDSIRSESQYSTGLQNISASTSSPTENRRSSSTANAVERRTESESVPADARLHVIPPSSDARASPWRVTTTHSSAAVYGTTTIYRGGAESGSLDQQTSGSADQVISPSQPWQSTSTSSSSSPSPLRSDSGFERDLRRGLDPGRKINSRDRNVTSHAPEQCLSQSQHLPQPQSDAVNSQNRHGHPRRPCDSCDAHMHRSREEHAPEQLLAVSSGTSSSSSSDHDRKHSPNIIIRPWKSISMSGKKTGKDEQCSETRIHVQPDYSGTGSGTTMSLRSSDMTSVIQTCQSMYPAAPAYAMKSVPSSDLRSPSPVSASVLVSVTMEQQSSSLLNATGISSGNIVSTVSSICRALSLHASNNCIGRTVQLGQKRNGNTSPLDTLGVWLLIWAGCLLFSALFRGIFNPVGANSLAVLEGIV